MQEYREGYARTLRDLGYATTSATHLEAEKFKQVVAAESEEQALARASLDWTSRAAVMQYLLVDRDLLAVCGLWESYLRGHDFGRLDKRCVQDRKGVSLFPRLLGKDFIITPGLPYQVAPNGTKTKQEQRAGVVHLEAKAAGEEDLCFLRRLQRLQLDCARAGISDSEFLLRPEREDHRDFKDKAMDSAGLNKRYQKLMEKHELRAGETLHGIRRGTMQHARDTGSTPAEVGARALQVTPAVTLQYLDTSRETNGSQRDKSARKRLHSDMEASADGAGSTSQQARS